MAILNTIVVYRYRQDGSNMRLTETLRLMYNEMKAGQYGCEVTQKVINSEKKDVINVWNYYTQNLLI